ncbi:MAG: CPBP family intramembrane metalloprotease [Oscillospiraceae bacterium]|nr:CPBP family intramembrane metalloprotease [Oscillospiraceae bacterium]
MHISDNLAAPCLLVAAMLILILFQSALYQAGGAIYPEPEGQEAESEAGCISLNGVRYVPDRFFALSVAANVCAFLLPGIIYVKFKSAGHSKKLKFGFPKPQYLPLCLYMVLLLFSGTVLINALLFCFGQSDFGVSGVLPLVFQTGGNAAYDMGVLTGFVLLPAVCEEFFFRSVIAAEYEKHGAFCACALSALGFAISHFSLKFLPSYIFAAIIFYVLAKITNSVFFAMFLHMGYNFFCIYLADKFLGALNFEQNRAMFVFVVAIIFIVCMFFVLNALEGIYYKKADANEPSPESAGQNGQKNAAAKFLASLASPTFIAAIVIFFVYINI